MKSTQKNPWKIAFFTFFTVIILIIIGIVFWLNSILNPSESVHQRPPSTEQTEEGAEFTVITTKEDVNYWMERELKKETGNGGDYALFLDDYVYFQTEVRALGFNVPVEMVFEPRVTDEGNVELLERSFSLGGLNLPSSTVLQLIESGVDLPEWIYIYPAEGMLYLNLQEVVTEEVKIKVQSFDLKENEIKILLTVP